MRVSFSFGFEQKENFNKFLVRGASEKWVFQGIDVLAIG